MAAGRGVLAVLVGNRQAAGYFSFTERGVAGAIFALLASLALNAGLPNLLGLAQPGEFARVFLFMVISEALQMGFAAIVLRQFARMDGLVPYIVASSWASFFANLLVIGITAAGVPGDLVGLPLAILSIVLLVNVARLIVTLAPLQIAALIVAQLVAVIVGLTVFNQIFPGILDLPV